MQPKNTIQTILILYIPVVFAYFLVNSPIISYFIAWGGSFFIFYITWFSPSAYYDRSIPIYKQVMRPIFLTQFIFAGFMCSTSIFYFMDHLGYRFLTEQNYGIQFRESEQTDLIATAQRLSLLAHAAMTSGLILAMNLDKQKARYVQAFENNDFLIWLGIIVFGIGSICQQLSGLSQIAIPLTIIGISCSAILFLKGVIHKNMNYLGIGATIFILNFIHASLSGYKEPIITNIIFLACVFFPYYKKTIIYLAVPVGYLLLYFLPTYNNTVRQSWNGEISAEEAQNQAFTNLNQSTNEDIENTNWAFLTRRLSEIEMFTQFINYVPAKHDFYQWEIIGDSFEALIPRLFWSEKPNMETVSMQRVYDAGVANKMSRVSAKTRPVVDAYLSWGIPGVFFCMMIYGLLIQYLCNTAEKLFGGYELGCVIIFNSIFQGLWRGNNFEFMFNNIFWGFIIMMVLNEVLKLLRILKPNFN